MPELCQPHLHILLHLCTWSLIYCPSPGWPGCSWKYLWINGLVVLWVITAPSLGSWMLEGKRLGSRIRYKWLTVVAFEFPVLRAPLQSKDWSDVQVLLSHKIDANRRKKNWASRGVPRWGFVAIQTFRLLSSLRWPKSSLVPDKVCPTLLACEESCGTWNTRLSKVSSWFSPP